MGTFILKSGTVLKYVGDTDEKHNYELTLHDCDKDPPCQKYTRTTSYYTMKRTRKSTPEMKILLRGRHDDMEYFITQLPDYVGKPDGVFSNVKKTVPHLGLRTGFDDHGDRIVEPPSPFDGGGTKKRRRKRVPKKTLKMKYNKKKNYKRILNRNRKSLKKK